MSYEASIYATNTSFKTLVISEENHYGAMEHFEKFNTEFTAGKNVILWNFAWLNTKTEWDENKGSRNRKHWDLLLDQILNTQAS